MRFEIREMLIIGGAGALALVLLLMFLRSLLGGRRKRTGAVKQVKLREDLEEYPPPPPAKGRRLLVDGLEVRVRLVVVAPAGTQRANIQADDVTELLDDWMRGLGVIVSADKPRVRIWPPQLSATGFAPTFFRLVPSPDADGARSAWVRMAGTIKVAGEPYLLGLALWSEDDSKIGALDLAPNQWIERLKVER
jgi:hypothetical protein